LAINADCWVVVNRCNVLLQLSVESVHHSGSNILKLWVKCVCSFSHLIKIILNFLNFRCLKSKMCFLLLLLPVFLGLFDKLLESVLIALDSLVVLK
jgi:hypothetical protein